MQNKLDNYKQALYKVAKRYDRYKYYTIYLSIALLLFSFYLTGVYIYYPTVLALFLQILGWYYSWRAKDVRRVAHDIQTEIMLKGAFGRSEDGFNLSSLIASLPKLVHDIAHEITEEDDYEIGPVNEPEDKLLRMIQSNTYWNFHLYNEEHKRRLQTLAVVFSVFLIGILLSLPFINTGVDLTWVRILIAVASLPIFYELLESAIILHRSSLRMREIDNDISRIRNVNTLQLIGIFSKYNNLKLESPDISDKVFEKNKENLERGWEIRLNH